MEKQAIKIAIVEDDATLGPALVEALKRAGFTASLYTKPGDLLSAVDLQEFHSYVIDCMLPRMSGVDLAAKIREKGEEHLTVPIYLMSGIFRDKSFMKDAIHKTSAKRFFEKPFDLNDLTKAIEDELSDKIDVPLEPLQNVLFNPNPSPTERLNAVTGTEHIHGFELPRIMSLMMAPGVTGILHLSTSEGDNAEIHFFNGKIVSARVKDPRSFFGALLVEKDFVDHEELEATLTQANPDPNKRIGERLIDANLISPHVIDIVNTEQMGIRLSKLVRDTSYDIHFAKEQVHESSAFIDDSNISPFFSAWLSSKIRPEWLKTHYLNWYDYTVIKGAFYSTSSSLNFLPPVNQVPDLLTKVIDKKTLGQLVSELGPSDDVVLAAIHMLILGGFICFDSSSTVMDFDSQLDRLKKIREQQKDKSYFDILGINQRTKQSEVKKIYHDLAKTFHPDKLPPTAPDEVVELTKEVFAKMTKAHTVLTNDQERSTYIKELEQGQADKILQSETLFEEAKVLLKSSQAKRAIPILEEAISLRPPPAELILHLLWAKMLNLSAYSDQGKVFNEIENGLNKVPPEDRHTAIYYFVKGLFQRLIGENDMAKSNLKHALALSPNFIEARRELNILEIKGDNKPVDLLHADLKDVVGQLFKKKR
jgi:CheY-like chemotaxis protein